MKLITALGDNPGRAKYRFPGEDTPFRDKEGNREWLVFAACLAHYLAATNADKHAPGQLLLLANKDTLEIAKAEAESDGSRWRDLTQTPWGKPVTLEIDNSYEMQTDSFWKIFTLLSEHVEQGESVVLDVTSSFRVFPLFAILALQFLRVTKKIVIHSVWYAPYDQFLPVCDVMDLTSFVRLFELTSAADRFVASGDGRALTCQLAALAKSERDSGSDLADGLTRAAGDMKALTQALLLLQSPDILKNADAAATHMTLVTPNDRDKPLEQLLKYAATSVRGIAMAGPRDEGNQKKLIIHLFALLEWYHEREMWGHVLTLSSELLICCATYLCYPRESAKMWKSDARARAILYRATLNCVRGLPGGEPCRGKVPTDGSGKRAYRCEDSSLLHDIRVVYGRSGASINVDTAVASHGSPDDVDVGEGASGQTRGPVNMARHAFAHAGFAEKTAASATLATEAQKVYDDVIQFKAKFVQLPNPEGYPCTAASCS